MLISGAFKYVRHGTPHVEAYVETSTCRVLGALLCMPCWQLYPLTAYEDIHSSSSEESLVLHHLRRSRNHTLLKVESDAFWAYSFDEMAALDLPAILNHVLTEAGVEKVWDE